MTLKSFPFLLLVFIYTISCSSSRKLSTQVDLSNQAAVVNFINTTTPCEQIFYIEANKDQIVKDTAFGSLLLLNVSRYSKRGFYMPKANDSSILSTQFQTEMLQEQLDSIKLDLRCK
jgi:hypothetical protein